MEPEGKQKRKLSPNHTVGLLNQLLYKYINICMCAIIYFRIKTYRLRGTLGKLTGHRWAQGNNLFPIGLIDLVHSCDVLIGGCTLDIVSTSFAIFYFMVIQQCFSKRS